MKSIIALLLFLLIPAGQTMINAQESAQTIALPDTLPMDPSIVYGKLENGLTYYIRHNTKPEHRVELRLVVRAGSVLEDDDQQGLAHFVEHMAFNGTEHFQKNGHRYLKDADVKLPKLNMILDGFPESSCY